MAAWRRRLFLATSHITTDAAEHYGLPRDQSGALQGEAYAAATVPDKRRTVRSPGQPDSMALCRDEAWDYLTSDRITVHRPTAIGMTSQKRPVTPRCAHSAEVREPSSKSVPWA